MLSRDLLFRAIVSFFKNNFMLRKLSRNEKVKEAPKNRKCIFLQLFLSCGSFPDKKLYWPRKCFIFIHWYIGTYSLWLKRNSRTIWGSIMNIQFLCNSMILWSKAQSPTTTSFTFFGSQHSSQSLSLLSSRPTMGRNLNQNIGFRQIEGCVTYL